MFETFKPAACNALRAFRSSKPWRGTVAERQRKFQDLHFAICEAYGVGPTRLVLPETESPGLGGGGYHGGDLVSPPAIILTGKLSVVTYLFGVGAARGFRDGNCRAFAFAIFKRIFPYSYARCQLRGGMLVQVERRIPAPTGPVSVLDCAIARGAAADEDGNFTMGAVNDVGLAFMGGCEGCNATVACYNSFPTRTGNIRCRECVGDLGFATAAAFEEWCARTEETSRESYPQG